MASADRLIEIFNEAKARPAGADRERLLAEACRDDPGLKEQVLSLLQAHEGAGDFLKYTILPPTALATEKPGDRIGHYKLLEPIGEGGCGVVYMAEQEEPVRRRVALKIIKLGMDTRQVIARFEAERQALALMDHPNIAKVFDAGATETGRPFFVMELVRGIKITDYCDQNQFSTGERLGLFIQVCQAIQHAHQKGVIHRDIKPSNILVAQHDSVAVPKVIDFGIAKATTDQRLTDKTLFTAFEQFIGTPAYMSPEQAQLSGLDIDTRTDIYSLGVLLYELLTGSTPFDAKELMASGLDAMRRTILEKEPVRPSTRLSTMLEGELTTAAKHRRADAPRLIHLIRGDLDWIVMKCLDKDRSRRYETANGLAMDLQRHLKSEPVFACPPSAAYRFRKFARRNKVVLLTAAGIAMALLLTMAALVVSTFLIAREQRSTANALHAETRAKGELAQTLEREQRNSYFHRITIAHRELLENDLLKAEALLDECVPRDGQPDYRAWEWDYLKRLCRVEPITLRGQMGNWFQKVAFSPDGQRLASAGQDNTVKVWDATTGEELIVLPDAGEIGCVTFRPPEGRWLVTGDRNGAVNLWDTTTRRVVRTFGGHPATVRDVSFSPDGRYLASASEDKTVKVWDATTGDLLYTLNEHERAVLTVAFSRDGQRLASGSLDTTVRIWDTTTGKGIRTLRGHRDPVPGVAFSPDDQRLASASFDGSVKIWDLTTGQETLPLDGHILVVNGVAFIDSGRRLASVGGDKAMKIWDATTGQVVLTLRGHAHDLTGLACSPDGRRLASVSQDGTTKIWDSTPLVEGRADHESVTLRGHTGGIWDLSFSRDGRRLASAGLDATVKVWDARTGREDLASLKHTRVVFGVAFSPDGQRIASGSAQLSENEPSYLKVWDATTGQEVFHTHGNNVEAFDVEFSPINGQWIVTSNLKGDVTVWDAATGHVVRTLDSHGPEVFGLAFSSDGRRLATLSAGGAVTVHDATRWDEKARQEPLLTFRAHKTWVRGSLALSSDGRRLVVPGDENTVNIWEVTTTGEREVAALQLTLRGHTAQVWGVAFSPDGKSVASAGEDKTVKLWNARTGGEPIRTLRGHSSVVGRVAFSPDGTRLASASFDKTVRVWDLTRRDEIPGDSEAP